MWPPLWPCIVVFTRPALLLASKWRSPSFRKPVGPSRSRYIQASYRVQNQIHWDLRALRPRESESRSLPHRRSAVGRSSNANIIV
ncbi:hypothetical protein B0H11DRAFT_2050461, partial [Mycena galericulata]